MTNVKPLMELRTDRLKLKDVFPDRTKRYAEKLHINADEIEYVKKGIPIDPREIKIEEGERAAIRLITTPKLDRDYEILIPDGADLDDFRQSPSVLFAHSYSSLPVGKDIWIKQTKRGILAKTTYANHQFAEDVFQCVKGGFLNSNSVGFIPVESVTPSDSRFRGVVDRLKRDYDISPDEANQARRIYTKWILLEHSDVPVASNMGALNIAVSKGELIIESSTMKKSLGLEPWEEITIEDEPDIAVKNDPHFFEFEPSAVITKPEPDVTENYIRLRQRDPDDFVKGSFRTITISAGKGIKAVVGKLKSDPDGSMVIQSYLFDKDKWTVAEAEAWVEEHKKVVFVIETSPEITIEEPPEDYRKIIQEKISETLAEMQAHLSAEQKKEIVIDDLKRGDVEKDYLADVSEEDLKRMVEKALKEQVEVAIAKVRGRVI